MGEFGDLATSDRVPAKRKAVFLDRDGTINVEVNYLGSPEAFQLLPDAGKAIAKLNKAGWLTVIISNQSGIGRGYFTLETLHRIHDKMVSQLSNEGAHIDAIFFCPHTPEEKCSCRKPSPEMILKAARDLDIDLGRSWMVGDKAIDAETGKKAGCHTALVLTGHGQKEEKDSNHADLIKADLIAFVDHILEEVRHNG